MKKLLFVLLISLNTFSQDGSIDNTFNSTDLGNYFGDGLDNYVRTACKQSDGKIIVGGDYYTINPRRIGRYNIDGTIDETFDVGTGSDGTIMSLDIQNDGKILVGGLINNFNGQNQWGIVRLNSNGSIDSSFNPNLNGYVTKIKILSDGKILIGGTFSTVNGVSRNKLAKLNTDGSLDSSFAIGTGFNNSVLAIKEQSDNKIIIGGSFTTFNSLTKNRILRLNSDGSIDNTFSIGSGFNSTVWDIDIQNSEIIIVGNFTDYNSSISNKIVRLNSNGILDTNFNIGTGFDKNCYTINVLEDNSIIVGGEFNFFNSIERNLILKLNSNGSLNTNFNLGNIDVDGTIGIPFHIKILLPLNSNEIFVGGYFAHFNSTYRSGLMNITVDGNITTFNNGTGISGNAYVYKLLKTNDSKYYVLGRFDKYNGQTNRNLAKINYDGSIDLSYNSGLGTNNQIVDADLQNDEKLIIVGNFTKYNGVTKNYICRINQDGTIDNTFNIGSGFNDFVKRVKVLSNGKILVSGSFTNYNGISVNNLIRLNSDGTIDNSFNIGSVNGYITTFEVDSNNKIFVLGNFTNFNGFNTNTLVKLNEDGTVDNSLVIQYLPDSTVTKIAIQNDGKIILGGYFTNFNNYNSNKLIRINSNGTVDTSFNIGSGFYFPGSAIINNITIQPDNKIIIAGIFESYNSIPINNFLRLENNGLLDNSFNTGYELFDNNNINAILLDGVKILIGGGFTKYNGEGKNRITRLNFNSLLNLENLSYQKLKINMYPNPVSEILKISLTTDKELEKVNIYNQLGQLIKTEKKQEINISSLAKGTYFIEVITNKGKATKQIIVN
ncbi:T9SS type A sorting domain-containing protein [Flavobacterium okayamense]|uniref:Secretion system C-terminal sorting domain-containing protein n=1 Tax=Flavobacterium okayamense TaxID=2830782 RepID=A0ABN6HU49_9FLAO|nr:T9SS type A sorting domain-containing protein [Flavobacterium okayamense]BCY27811.1 hypothetical protein KK2020170_06790 [Flavobacterium okayamense]